jgi:transcriptional regulator NrdR family protein
MSSSPPRKALTSEPLPCPECGAVQMTRTVENCRLEDGLTVRRLRHFKCHSCDARFFDDNAMRRIQAERNKQGAAHAV